MPTLRRTPTFWFLAVTLGALLFASSAPSPLYVVYQDRFDFSTVTLTAVFAVYALALLLTLLVLGSISDHIGRRPTVLIALAIEIAAMVAFAAADAVWVLIIARVLQGVGTAIAMGAISAALLDLGPESRPTLGALTGVVAPMSGLALGALATGLLVDYGPAPTRLVFWLLLATFALAFLAALAMPETVRPDGLWRHSLRPRIGIPPHMRAAFVAALPCLAATWALGGLVLSLGPSLTREVLGEESHLAGGLPIFLLAGISAVASVRVRDINARLTAQAGLGALITGVALALVALATGSAAVFLVGAAVCGLGFGPAFGGIFRVLTTMAPENRRAEVVSSVLTVSYVAFSLPAVVAGFGVVQIGLRSTATIYGATLIAMAVLALGLSGRLEEGDALENDELAEAVAG
ncbi:MAG: MFS transporter [Thermoleophilaceae bacterium]